MSTKITGDTVSHEFYLTFFKDRMGRILRTRPGLSEDEYAIKLKLNIPKRLFDKPYAEVEINLPEEMIVSPEAGNISVDATEEKEEN